MRWLLRLPIATPLSRQLMLLYLTGRKTGNTYLQPVSFVRDGDTLLTPGGGRWKLEAESARLSRLSRRCRTRQTGWIGVTGGCAIFLVAASAYELNELMLRKPVFRQTAVRGHVDTQSGPYLPASFCEECFPTSLRRCSCSCR
jgi:hypothetical protein